MLRPSLLPSERLSTSFQEPGGDRLEPGQTRFKIVTAEEDTQQAKWHQARGGSRRQQPQ